MRPKVKGSSTMGVKKSTVCTNATSGDRRYTPASSALSKPTRTLGSCCRANFPSTVSSAAGLSLDAQPAALTVSVRRTLLLSDMGIIVEEGKRHQASGIRRQAIDFTSHAQAIYREGCHSEPL